MKKILKINKYAIYTLLVMSMLACNEWMNLEPENDLTRQEFWQKEAEVEAVVAAMYDAFRETSMQSLILGEVRADMFSFTGIDFGDYAKIARSDINPTNNAVKWEKYYFAINLANTLMQFSPDVLELDDQFTETEKLAYDAEALFIRSLSYFYLVRLWKEVPIILSASSSDTVDFFKPKSAENQVLNQIIKDLQYAETIAYTTENINNPSVFKGRANIYSIQALLADIYLWMSDYEKCIVYCDKVINSGLYSLVLLNNWFSIYYPGNSSEGIFEIQYNDKYVGENNPIYDKLLPIKGMTQVTQNNLTILELYKTSDIRKLSPSILLKYQGTAPRSTQKREASERDANFIYYRYSDILLMKAEALAELGFYTESEILINQVVERAGLLPVDLNESLPEFREYIMDERGREFAFEGKRWFDILRFAKKEGFAYKNIIINMILENTTVQLRPVLRSRVIDTMSYYLPIPESDMLSNAKLVQNPYYDR